MLEDIPRISVRIITYNQEDVIERTLKSLILQEDYIYEICINDDCSKDGTWAILKKYANDYPNLIKPFQNPQNLGIFQNIEESFKHLSGDLIYGISGDDECPPDCFKKIIDFIRDNNIDVNKRICIYGDCVFVYPNGKRIMHTNELLLRFTDVLSLKIRGLLSVYGSCYSRSVADAFHLLSKGRSYVVEEAQDDQRVIFTESNYYLPICCYIYYAEYGVSSNMSIKRRQERVGMYDYLLDFLSSVDVKLKWSDLNYLHYRTAYLQYGVTGKKKYLLKAFVYYLGSVNLRYGIRGLEISRFWNQLQRRKVKQNGK